MFGVRYAERFIYARLSPLTAITSVLANGVAGLLPMPNAPQGNAYPVLLYFPDSDGTYGGPLTGPVSSETLRMRVILVTEGYDDSAILPAAEAMLAALQDVSDTIDGFFVTCHAVAESSFPRIYVDGVEGAIVPTVQLGIVFEVEILSAGG